MVENKLNQNLELMTCAEVSRFLGIKCSTLYVWMCKKQLPQSIYRRLGRKPTFIRSEVEKWFLAGAKMVQGGKNARK